MTDRPTHLSPKPFLALNDARIALNSMDQSMREARAELAVMEQRAANLLLSDDDDARDVIAEYAVLKLARATFLLEYPDPMVHDKGHPARDGWSDLCHRTYLNEAKLTALGDTFQRAREAMATRITEEAKRGAAA